MTSKPLGSRWKLWLAVSGAVFAAAHCHAQIGETVPEIESRYGKNSKEAVPIEPATDAYLYRVGHHAAHSAYLSSTGFTFRTREMSYTVGFSGGLAVYEVVHEVEGDSDAPADDLNESEITTILQAHAAEWKEITGNKDGRRHWESADGKLLANYSKPQKALMIETPEFARRRAAKVAGKP